MVTGKIVIKNERGIHARPSAEVAKEAIKYKSSITVDHEGNKGNAKEVLQLIVLELYKGETVTLTAEGEDEQAAFDAVKALLEKQYDFD
ncbi:MAG: HPr family phosphocarrier protein [Spirochaetales bacterium]|nr:HPr family phosphocarrier protein [Spirochaetales bacterium]